MRFDLLIDGYNLMHAAGLARERYAQGDLERCRNRLLSLVRHGLTKEQRANTVVVFDGRNAQGYDEPEFRFHGIQVFFSRADEEADDVIEQLIASHSFPKQLRIISSDHRLHKAGRARRSEVTDSEEFLNELEKGTRRKKSHTIQNAPPLPEKPVDTDAEQWLAEFGEIDLSEIEENVRREVKQEEKIRKQVQQQQRRHQISSDSKQTVIPANSEENAVDEAETEESLPLDLEFWENRIAELDQEDF